MVIRMKTAVVMERPIFGATVRQNHKTKCLCAGDLHKIGNTLRKSSGLPTKQMAQYFNLDSTRELIREVCLVENISEKEVKSSLRGKNGGTWIHPIVFVDMAMWYSPQLKVKIIQWVIDGLLDARDGSGDSYKRMASSLKQQFPKEFSPMAMAEIANTIAAECRVGLGKDRWQKATEDQLKLRDSIQDKISTIADLCPNMGTTVSKAIQKSKVAA